MPNQLFTGRVPRPKLLLAIPLVARLAIAQAPQDTARCRVMLATPPRDSMFEVIGMRTSAFDSRIRLPAE